MSGSGAAGGLHHGAARPLALRVFRALLRLYPAPFRRRYGRQLEAVFLAERASGRRGSLGFWAWIMRDTVSSAVNERVSTGSGPGRPPTPRRPGLEMIEDLLHDLRYAARSLIAAPTYSLVCVAILTLGIGANAIVFTLVDTLLLTPPAGIHAPGELVRLTRTHELTRSGSFGYPDWEYVRDQTRTLSGIVAFEGDSQAASLTRSPADEPVRVAVELVSVDFFRVLGVEMARGRGFAPQEGAIGADGRMLVASHSSWQSVLGSDPGVLDGEVRLNGQVFRVIGVADPAFRGTSALQPAPDFWAPVTAQPLLRADGSEAWLRRMPNQRITWLSSIGRLAPGVTIEQARAEMGRLADDLAESFPDDAEGQGIGVFDQFASQPATHERLISLTGLLGSVVVAVLLIACANIAVLQLARGSARQAEIGVRVALGASRGRVVRQLLVESLLLASVGAAAGYLLAFRGAGVVGAWLPLGTAVDYRPNAGVLLFSLVAAVLSAALSGLAPAVGVARRGARETMRARTVTGGRSAARSALVVGQIAVSLVLVLGASLFVRSLLVAEAVDPGFATGGRVFVSIFTGTLGYTQEELNSRTDAILERVAASPIVVAASVAVMTPFRGAWTSDFSPTGDDDDSRLELHMNSVGPGYFATMGIPVLAGREFDAGDRVGAPSVVVVNEVTAEQLWPGESPIGKTMALSDDEAAELVVGMVASTNYRELGEEPLPQAFLSAYQSGLPRLVFVASTSGGTPALARHVQEQVAAVDPRMTIARVESVEEAIESQIGTYRMGARAFGTFAAIAAVLAAVGLYGVLSFLVAAETREIGIRMALGATEGGVLRGVVGYGLRIALVGVAIGIAAAVLGARLLSGMLYGIEPHDPISFALVPVLLAAVAIVASVVPAQRAARVDPMEALRAE